MSKKTKEYKRVKWSTLQPKEITWLWQDWIPFGKISILAGDSGLGKTTIAIDIAARLTTGRPMPMSDVAPLSGDVLFQSNEDEVEDTLLPRCIAAGGDKDRISSIEADDLNIDEDCDIIEQNIRETNARFIVWDPLQGFMGRNADMCRITDVRRVLRNLGKVAARTDSAMLIIAHQTKAGSGKELHRVFGSVDITATARSVLRVSESENDPDTKIISHIKSSVSRPCPPIAYRFNDDGTICYLGEYDGDDAFEEIPEDSSKLAQAVEIMCHMLKDGPRVGTEVYNACIAAGMSVSTIQRAKKRLNVLHGRDGKKHLWALGLA